MSFRSLHTAHYRTTIILISRIHHVTNFNSLPATCHHKIFSSPPARRLSSREYSAIARHSGPLFHQTSAVCSPHLHACRPDIRHVQYSSLRSKDLSDESPSSRHQLAGDHDPLQPKDIQSKLDDVFLRAWDKDAESILKHRIAVCVSGGPDSMALAYLLQNTPMLYDVQLEVIAFIVDHKARPGSTDEAQQVQRNLADIGISSSILTIQWPEGQNPSDLTNFESQAREQRYRLIAGAALAQNVQDIYLGHHCDDQAETVLMRIIRRQHSGLNGLQGMPPESAIPCCDGLFGAYESRFQHSAKHVLRSYRLGHTGTRAPLDFITEGGVQLSAPFGLVLHRPLLNFPKSRLIQTCEDNGVKYVVDQTNFDPTITMRNTIRHMYSKHQLPRSLHKPRMIELRQRAEAEMQSIRDAGRLFLKNSTITTFDLRSGTLMVRLPKTPGDAFQEYQGARHAISMLIETVSPLPRSEQQIQVDGPTLRKFYPDYPRHTSTDRSSSSIEAPKAFTCHGVMIEQTSSPGRNVTGSIQDSADHTSYLFSRQPFRSTELTDVTTSFIRNPVVKSVDGTISHRTQWALWDNRYWIRLTLSPPHPAPPIPTPITTSKDLDKSPSSSAPSFSSFQVRPYEEADFSTVWKLAVSQPTQSRYNQIVEQIKHAAPKVKTRCTLPVLTYKDQIIGFPTFGFIFKHKLEKLGITDHLHMEVRYKAVDWIGYLRGPSPEVTGLGSREKVYDEEKKKWIKKVDVDSVKGGKKIWDSKKRKNNYVS